MNLKKLSNRETYLAVLLVLIGSAMLVFGPGGALDIQFFYTSAQANDYIRGLSASRAQAYLLNETMDLFFLTTYSLLYFFVARRFYFQRAWIALIPGFLDLIETVTIIFLLLNRTWEPPVWLGYITCLKWTTGFIIGVPILVGFVRRLKKYGMAAN